MAKLKNAARKHYVAEWSSDSPTEAPQDKGAEWKLLAKHIKTVNDESDENTEDDAFYDGDGTPEETVVSITPGYSFEGYYDAEDEAQKLIVSKKFKLGEGRRVWFKVVTADGKKQFTGIANVSSIKAGDGDAGEFEKFEVTIKWIQIPKETPVG